MNRQAPFISLSLEEAPAMTPDAALIDFFRVWSGAPAEVISDAGGRVNLIGDHTDYYDGFALPAAIGLRTRAVARHRTDGIVRIRSLAQAAEVECPLKSLAPNRQLDWQAYALGPFWALRERRAISVGADVLIASDVPLGGGLSSSGSLLVALVGLIAVLVDDRLTLPEVAGLARYAENAFCRVPCGVMDQMASACGVARHALLLDCKSLELYAVPMPAEWAIVVADSGVKHAVAGPEYAERQRDGLNALARIQCAGSEISARELTLERLDAERHRLPERLYRRLRHVVTENARVLEAVPALVQADRHRMRNLLLASQQSLALDYEVSCREIDILVQIAVEFDGCIGARLTGAGFGGNTINLVDRARAHAFSSDLVREYFERTGRRTIARIVEPAHGLSVRRLS